jgi:DNA replication protein DnaC
MDTQQVIQLMQSLRLKGMQSAMENLIETRQWQQLEASQLLNQLLQSEWDERYNRKIHRLTSAARFRYQASMAEIKASQARNLTQAQLAELALCNWIRNGENLLITGPTGVGKSYLASALGHHACHNGLKTTYFSMQKLFRKLQLTRLDGTFHKETEKIARADLLIIDDFGLFKLDDQQRLDLLELIEDRHSRKSTVIASQLPVSAWYDIIGEPTLADAILDRIINHSHRIELKGDSLRKKM